MCYVDSRVYTTDDLDPEFVLRQARSEVIKEEFRERVEAEKERLRTHRPWWHKVFPYRITIERRA